MANNIRICSNNLVETGSLLTSISASTEEVDLPISNLTNSIKSLPWRSTTKASEQSITINFAAQQTLSMIALLFTNLSPTATVKVALFTLSSDGSPVYTTPYTLVLNNDLVGQAIIQSFATYSYGKGCNAPVYFAERLVQKLIIYVLDTSNPAAYLQVGNLVVGKYWSPLHNFERNQTLLLQDDSKHSRTDATDLLVDAGPRYRKIAFKFSAMQEIDRITCINLLRAVGVTYPLFISLFPENLDPTLEALYCMQGILESSAPLEMLQSSWYSIPLSIIEL